MIAPRSLKFSHKISKIVAPDTYRRAARSARRRLFPIDVDSLLSKIDQSKLRELQQRYSSSSANYARLPPTLVAG